MFFAAFGTMRRLPCAISLCLFVAGWATGASAGKPTAYIDSSPPPDDLNGSNFTYPYPIQRYKFISQKQDVEMAFMDVPPAFNGTLSSSDQVAVLLHGKNFCGATWNETIRELTSVGYRVIAIDQVGWCKSTKPVGYQVTQLHTISQVGSVLTSVTVHLPAACLEHQ